MTSRQFRIFADLLPEPMILISGEGIILSLNRSLEEQLGISLQILEGTKLTEIVTDPPDEIYHYLNLCSRSNEMVLGALTLQNHSGEIACRVEGTLLTPKTRLSSALLMLRLIPRQTAAEKFLTLNLRIAELGREIKRRKRAEQEAQEQAERLLTILSSIGDGVIVTDSDGKITNMNGVAESLTGWTITEALNQPLDKIFHIVNEETQESVENPAVRALRDGITIGLGNNTLLVTREGKELPIDDSVAPIRCSEGKLIGCVLVFREITERRRHEKEIQSNLLSARLLASIVESSSDAILRASLDGIIQSWNAGSERLFGYTAEQVIGRHISIIIPSDRLAEEDMIIARVKTGERIHHYETVRQQSDGGRIMVSLTASPITDDTGKVVGYSKIVRDITSQRRAEERGRELMLEAAEADAKFRVFFEQGALFAGIMHPDGTIIETNRLSLETCGYTREEVIGKYFWDCPWWNRSPMLIEQIKSAWQQAVGGDTYRAEMTYFVADGSERILDFIMLPIMDESGSVIFLAPTGTDITDRKRAEQQLAEALRFYRSSIDALSGHIAVLDENGVIIEVNDAWRRFADENDFPGVNCGVGENYVEICEASTGECSDDGTIARGIRNVLVGHNSTFEMEYPCHSPSEKRWFLMKVTRFKSPGPVRVVVSHENVTKRLQAEEALREAGKRKDEFLATLAHELRNPLAPIRNAVQVLRLKDLAEAELDWARNVIDRQVDQMTRLVDDLMDVSRITRGKIELRKQIVELRSIVNDAVEASRPLIDQLGHTLSIDIPAEAIILNADSTRLAQVLLNLLNNAAKYTERGGKIGLTVKRHGNQVIISVEDNGIGIPSDAMPNIFELFRQVDSSIERSQGGLGIGLTLVKRLVEMHGGTVEVQSQGLRKGSEFIIRLPIEEDNMSGTLQNSPDDEPARSARPLRILIVDDNQDSADSMAIYLKTMGHEVLTTYDGLSAVEKAISFQPRIILLDIGLPKLNGYEAAQRIREKRGTDVMLIALTGWGQKEDRRRSEAAGFDSHMVKPVDFDKLEEIIASISTQKT